MKLRILLLLLQGGGVPAARCCCGVDSPRGVVPLAEEATARTEGFRPASGQHQQVHETHPLHAFEDSEATLQHTLLCVREHTHVYTHAHASHTRTQTDKQTDRQTDRETDRQTDRQTDTHTHTHTHTHTQMCSILRLTLFPQGLLSRQ